ncbi:hypothetical protein GGU11DRAFT_375880 [Lentinula aff. detonsa]|nr:hypothetical protein GGU11DRAFT_375880 [Lentinula aff. detonsa]
MSELNPLFCRQKNYTIMRLAPAYFSICVFGLFAIAHAAPYATRNTIHSNSDDLLEIRSMGPGSQPFTPPPTPAPPPSPVNFGTNHRLPMNDNRRGTH